MVRSIQLINAVHTVVVEFLDEVQVDAINKYSKMTFSVLPSLFLEFHGTEQEITAQAETVGTRITTAVCIYHFIRIVLAFQANCAQAMAVATSSGLICRRNGKYSGKHVITPFTLP